MYNIEDILSEDYFSAPYQHTVRLNQNRLAWQIALMVLTFVLLVCLFVGGFALIVLAAKSLWINAGPVASLVSAVTLVAASVRGIRNV